MEDSYDSSGRLTQRVSRPSASETSTESYTYNGNSFRETVTDARGNTTRWCYDVNYAGAAIAGSRGNLTRVISPPPTGGANPLVTLFQYDDKNNLVQTIPPRGVSNGATVDCATNLSGSVNTFYATDQGYDASKVSLLSVTRRWTDPELGQQAAVTRYEYQDAANPGRVTKVIPPRGNTGPSPDYAYATSFAYYTTGSQAGMLERVTDPLGNQTTYAYDAVGRQTSMVDPNGHAPGGVPAEHTWEYSYDHEDRRPRLTRAPAPQAGGAQLVSEARYDAVGNRSVAIAANGQVTKYLYDERNQLQEVQESPNSWTDPALTPSPLYQTVNSYDHRGNLTRVTRASGDGTYERAVDYLIRRAESAAQGGPVSELADHQPDPGDRVELRRQRQPPDPAGPAGADHQLGLRRPEPADEPELQ